jgi:hypothetical protein
MQAFSPGNEWLFKSFCLEDRELLFTILHNETLTFYKNTDSQMILEQNTQNTECALLFREFF